MAELQIDGSFEEQWGTMKTAVIRLVADMDGNGKVGVKGDVANIKNTLTRIEAYGRASAFWGKVVAGLLTLIFLAATAYFASLEVRGKVGLLYPQKKIILIPDDKVYNAGVEKQQMAIDKTIPR